MGRLRNHPFLKADWLDFFNFVKQIMDLHFTEARCLLVLESGWIRHGFEVETGVEMGWRSTEVDGEHILRRGTQIGGVFVTWQMPRQQLMTGTICVFVFLGTLH
jgi:hypothetical protein